MHAAIKFIETHVHTRTFFAQVLPPWDVVPDHPTSTMSRYEILASDLGVTDNRELREFTLAYGHVCRLMRKDRLAINKVYVLEYHADSSIKKAYEQQKVDFERAGKDVTETWIFHGSSSAGINGISQQGFKVGGRDKGVDIKNGKVHGFGVYASIAPATALQTYSTESKMVRTTYNFKSFKYLGSLFLVVSLI